jgi:hypothetical protein
MKTGQFVDKFKLRNWGAGRRRNELSSTGQGEPTAIDCFDMDTSKARVEKLWSFYFHVRK